MKNVKLKKIYVIVMIYMIIVLMHVISVIYVYVKNNKMIPNVKVFIVYNMIIMKGYWDVYVKK